MADPLPPAAPLPGPPLTSPGPAGTESAPPAPGMRVPLLAALGLGTPVLWFFGHVALSESGYGGRGPTLAWVLITFAGAIFLTARAHAAGPVRPLAVLVLVLVGALFALNQSPLAHSGLDRCLRCGDRREVRIWAGALTCTDLQETPVSALHDTAFKGVCPHEWTPFQGSSANLFGGEVEAESPPGAALVVSYSKTMPVFYRRCPADAPGEKALDTLVKALQHRDVKARLAAARHLGTAFYDDLKGMDSTGQDWNTVWSRHAPMFEHPENIH